MYGALIPVALFLVFWGCPMGWHAGPGCGPLAVVGFAVL
jgi:hypothetical protein